jgi:hypothetical protein
VNDWTLWRALGKDDKKYTLQLVRELLWINGRNERVAGAFGE